MNDWNGLRQKLFKAFANVPRPDFGLIPILGCCEAHEADFDWYRHHTWQEFEISAESRGFDPADFIAIHPQAFHYFTPGVLSVAMQRIMTDPYKYWDYESWIQHYIVDPAGEFKEKNLPYFDAAQRLVIAEILDWYKTWYFSQNGFDYDEPFDDKHSMPKVSDAVAQVWCTNA